MTQPSLATNSLVSIIIPCYQQGGLLPQAVGSALAQTHRPLEIILVNDGSTDSTGQVAAEFRDRFPDMIRVIEQPNRGQACARQAGLELARGGFLVMLDADDLLEPDMIRNGLELFAAQPQADAAVGDAWLIDAAGRRLRPWPQRQIVPWPQILANNPYGALAAMMARTVRVREAGGLAVPGSPGVEDWDLWARMARLGMRFVPLRRPAASYRQGAASTSHKALQMLQATLEMLERFREEYPCPAGSATSGPPLSDALYLELRNGKVFKALGLALSLGSPAGEQASILEALAPDRLSVRFCTDQFLEGIHYGFFLKMSQTLPPGLDRPMIVRLIESSLARQGLQDYISPLSRAVVRILENPLRKRSLFVRLRDRFYALWGRG